MENEEKISIAERKKNKIELMTIEHNWRYKYKKD